MITLPSVPFLLSPSNGATGVSISPLLTWRPAERAVSYTVQLARNDAFTTGLVTRENVTTTSLQCSNLQGKTRYFWRVKAVNANGASQWSPIWSFTTTAYTPLQL
jgi:hypothetical protein